MLVDYAVSTRLFSLKGHHCQRFKYSAVVFFRAPLYSTRSKISKRVANRNASYYRYVLERCIMQSSVYCNCSVISFLVWHGMRGIHHHSTVRGCVVIYLGYRALSITQVNVQLRVYYGNYFTRGGGWDANTALGKTKCCISIEAIPRVQ